MDEIKLPDFIQIPSLLINDRDLYKNDWLVYGVVYWYSKLKLQRCVLSNEAIANLIHSTAGSVANSLSRLSAKKYVFIVLEKRIRTEIIPLVFHTQVKPNLGTRFHTQVKPISHMCEENNSIFNKNIFHDRENLRVSDRVKKTSIDKKTLINIEDQRLLVDYLASKLGLAPINGKRPSALFTNYVKQAKAINKILSVGYTQDDIRWAIDELANDDFFNGKFDMMTVANRLPLLKAQAKLKKDKDAWMYTKD